MTIRVENKFKAGEECTKSGIYHFDGYIDGTRYPQPIIDEGIICLTIGDMFPEIKSLKKSCFWELTCKNIVNYK